jgi:micrococcal nuclease
MRHFLRYRRHSILALLAALLSVTLAYGMQSRWFDGLGQQAEQNQPGLYSVSRFIDGDTIEVNMNGHPEKVRFIGVDTPETHKPNTPVQCYGPAAAAFTKRTIARNSVRLVSDPLSTDRDRYDRLLRYVYLPDGTLLNQKLIQDGYGFYYPYFPFSKSKQFEADEKSAMSMNKGLWANCHPTPTDRGGYVSDPS